MLYYLPIGKITIKGEYAAAETSATPTATPTGTATLMPTSTPGALTITVAAEVEADPDCGLYYVTPHPNYLYEDEVHVAVNGKRLLSTGNVTTEDKTAEIVGALASLARTGVGIAKTKAVENQQPFNFTFHPSKYDEVVSVAGELRQRGIGLEIRRNGEPMSKLTTVVPAPQFGKNGLIFRTAASYTIRLTGPVSRGGTTSPPQYSGLSIDNTQQFLLPDPTQLYVMEYERMAFVKKVKNIGFTDGMLTDYQQKLPSPILGFLGIPKAIMEAVVPIPGVAPSGSGSASSTTASH